jgi:hypothetical protein
MRSIGNSKGSADRPVTRRTGVNGCWCSCRRRRLQRRRLRSRRCEGRRRRRRKACRGRCSRWRSSTACPRMSCSRCSPAMQPRLGSTGTLCTAGTARTFLRRRQAPRHRRQRSSWPARRSGSGTARRAPARAPPPTDATATHLGQLGKTRRAGEGRGYRES